MINPVVGPQNVTIDFQGNPGASQGTQNLAPKYPPIDQKPQNQAPGGSQAAPASNNFQRRANKAASALSQIVVGEDFEEPNYERLVHYLRDTHPRNHMGEEFGCCEAAGQLTGWHCCGSTTKKSDFDRMGLGVILYFRFVKYLIGFFFLFSIIEIPSLYFCIKSAQNYENSETSYKTYLYYTTVGSIGRGLTNCETATIGSSVTFGCPTGTLAAANTIQYGYVTETRNINCEYYSTFSWTQACNDESYSTITTLWNNANCEGATTCTITPTSSIFVYTSSTCQYYQNENREVFFRATCQDVKVPFASYEVDKETISYIMAGTDCGICVLFIIMIWTLGKSERATKEIIIGSANAVQDFTITVTNLPSQMDKLDIKLGLLKMFSRIPYRGKEYNLNVCDIQLAEPHRELSHQVELGKLRQKRTKLTRRMYFKYADVKASTEMTMDDLEKFAKEKGKKAEKDLKKIKDIKKKEEKISSHIKEAAKHKIVAAYVTFEDKFQRDVAIKAFAASPLTFCCTSCCGKCCCDEDHHLLGGRLVHVNPATSPDNIIWANMDLGFCDIFLRRLVSWIITIALWAVTFAFITYIRNWQNTLSQTVQPQADCTALEAQGKVTLANAESDPGNLGYTECFCRGLSNLSYQVCKTWTFDNYLNQAIPWIIVVVIIVTNTIMQYVFRALASFEKHKNASTMLSSRTIKVFIAQFLNTGVIILIVNARFSQGDVVNFLNGNYQDLIPLWYYYVGATLLTTMVINIVSLPFVNLILLGIRGLKRCCDRRCKSDPKITKKKTQKEWEKLYTGPDFLIDFRYSQISSVMAICLVFGSGMPFLYITTFINYLVLYWMDKFYILKVCKFTKNFDEKLEEAIRQCFKFMLIVHLAFAIWVYGNPLIFSVNSPLGSNVYLLNRIQTGAPYVLITIFSRAISYQNLCLTALFLLVVLYLFARYSVFFALIKLFRFCCGKKMARLDRSKTKYAVSKSYYSLIKPDDLQDEREFLEKQITVCKSESFANFLKNRLDKINHMIAHKMAVNEEHSDFNFVGIFSYNIGHNPEYKPYIKVEGFKN